MKQLKQQWSVPGRRVRHPARFPVSVRLLPEVDCGIQAILADFPHLDQSRVINDLLHDAINRLGYIG